MLRVQLKPKLFVGYIKKSRGLPTGLRSFIRTKKEALLAPMADQESNVMPPTGSVRSTISSFADGTRKSVLLHVNQSPEELPLVSEEKGSDVSGTVSSLVTIMVGAGVLSFPSLFSRVGVLYGIPMVLISACLSVYVCQTVGDAIGLVQERTGRTLNKFGDLGEACFGSSGKLVANIVVNGMFIGKVGCYMVLIGQNFAYLIPFPYRLWVLLFAGLIMITAFARDVSILEKFAIVGVIASALYFFSITAGSIQAGNSSGTFVATPPVKAFTFFSVLTVMMFGFGPTDVLSTVRREMKDPKQLPQALIVSHVIVALIYLSAGVLGYWGFGKAVEGNISLSMCSSPGCPGTGMLTNDTAGEKWISGYILAGAVVANLLVTIPIVLYCLFTGIETSYPADQPMNPVANAIMRVGVVLGCACVALFVPFFMQVLEIISSVLVVPMAFFLPITFGWKAAEDSNKPYSLPRKLFCVLLLLMATACLCIGTYEALAGLVHAMEENPEKANPIKNFWK